MKAINETPMRITIKATASEIKVMTQFSILPTINTRKIFYND